MAARLTRWLIFSVIVAMVPLAFDYFARMTDGSEAPKLAAIVSKGELLLISAAIAAAAIGEIIGRPGKRAVAELVATGACVVTFFFASLYYANVSVLQRQYSREALSQQQEQQPKEEVIFRTSVVLFIFTLISSAGCMVLSKEDEAEHK